MTKNPASFLLFSTSVILGRNRHLKTINIITMATNGINVISMATSCNIGDVHLKVRHRYVANGSLLNSLRVSSEGLKI